MVKKIVFVARDAAPSGAFALLADALLKRGHTVASLCGGGKPLAVGIPEIERVAGEANLVVLGMSSSEELAGPELAAGEAARKNGVAYGFYGDVRNCWGRAREGAWFAPLAKEAAFYLGVNETDAETAREVFPNAELIGTGNPLREEMFFPKVTREEVRGKLGIGDDTCLILAPGGKCAAVNIGLWSALADAVAIPFRKLQVILACHPGDRTPFALDGVVVAKAVADGAGAGEVENLHTLGIYDEIVKFGGGKFRIVPKAEMDTASLVVGSDLVIEFGSDLVIEFGSSEGMRAACLRIPVITYATELALNRLESMQGSRELELVDNGGSMLVKGNWDSDENLGSRIPFVLKGGLDQVRKQQEIGYPKPERPGATLEAMIGAIESILSSV